MKPIATLAKHDDRMIDLTRSLKLPHGSLTPGIDPNPRWPALRSLSEAERRSAHQEADEFTQSVLVAGLAFGLLMLAILAYHIATS